MMAAFMTAVFLLGAPSALAVRGEEGSDPVPAEEDVGTQMSSPKEYVSINLYGTEKREHDFNANWKFYLGDASGAQEPAFDDSGWRVLDLPHDYSVEQEYAKNLEAESGYLPGGQGWYRKNFALSPDMRGKRIAVHFDGVYMNASVYVNGHLLGTHPYGYTPFSFDLTEYLHENGENILAVCVDHRLPSSRWYSGSGIYRNVTLTVTDPVYVQRNKAVFKADHLAEEKDGMVHVTAEVSLANSKDEEARVQLVHTVFPKGGSQEGSIGQAVSEEVAIPAGSTGEAHTVIPVQTPSLWRLSDPVLYTIRTEVRMGETIVDTYDTDYGFRYTEFDPDTGFSLNGEKMKLKGVCMHHDQGALGSAAYRRAIERQVDLLKEMGCNSIRVTHNPASADLIDICNTKGMLLVEEAFDGWILMKNGNRNDYSSWFRQVISDENEILGRRQGMTWAQFDLEQMIRRGINAPSIIMWSLGNEVLEGTAGASVSEYVEVQKQLISWAQELDDSRPVTSGDNRLKGGFTQLAVPLADAGGIVGANYAGPGQMDRIHRENPQWKMYGSETASAVNSRGFYSRISGNKTEDKQLTSYDYSAVGWGHVASDAWLAIIKRDFMAGEYVWTGFDYIGEPTPWNGTGRGAVGGWPSPKNSYFGMIDTAGFPKDSYYFYQSQWNDDVHTLHILPAWNEETVAKDSRGNVPVVVYSDARTVELFFTGADKERRSLGKKTFTEKTTAAGYTYQIYEGDGRRPRENENLYMRWDVPFAPGTIEAVAYSDAEGTEVISDTEGRHIVMTTKSAARLSAAADRTALLGDGSDLAYVTIDVTDEDGNIIPDAQHRIRVSVEGAGELAGLDNGSAPDHDPYQADHRRAWAGKLLAIVRTKKEAGEIKVTASADGLSPSSVTLQAQPVEGLATGRSITGYKIAKHIYVQSPARPKLVRTLDVTYSDGTTGAEDVQWEDIPAATDADGRAVVRGMLAGTIPVSVNVNYISHMAALLNYSAATMAGMEPILPTHRPAVLSDGRILSVMFPVTWEPIDKYDFGQPGRVIVQGTSNVLGREIPVTASVRVQEEQLSLGKNIANSNVTVTQSIADDMQSDTLAAVNDGSTQLSPNSGGGANPTAWSNYKASQAGINQSQITFTYATKRRVGQMGIYFWRDGWSARYPAAGTTQIWVSDTGEEGTFRKLDTRETIGEEDGSVKPYVFEFSPVDALVYQIRMTNPDESLGNRKPCIGITEVEMKESVGTFVTNSEAALSALTFNGRSASASAIASGVYRTMANKMVEATPVSEANASMTILPAHEGIVRILLESEDHTERGAFCIELEKEEQIEAADDSRDYPAEKMSVSAGNSQNGQGADKAVDSDPSTLWHTDWYSAVPDDQKWFAMELENEEKCSALRYYSRGGVANGRIREYHIEVSTDNENWTIAGRGELENTEGWKYLPFAEDVPAKYIRLVAETTYGAGNQADRFISAGEIRVVRARTVTALDGAKAPAVISLEPSVVVQQRKGEAARPSSVTVTWDGRSLLEGRDYNLTYENDTEPGTAYVVVTGIYDYTGTIRQSYEIKEALLPDFTFAKGEGVPNETEVSVVDEDGTDVRERYRGHVLRMEKRTPLLAEELTDIMPADADRDRQTVYDLILKKTGEDQEEEIVQPEAGTKFIITIPVDDEADAYMRTGDYYVLHRHTSGSGRSVTRLDDRSLSYDGERHLLSVTLERFSEIVIMPAIRREEADTETPGEESPDAKTPGEGQPAGRQKTAPGKTPGETDRLKMPDAPGDTVTDRRPPADAGTEAAPAPDTGDKGELPIVAVILVLGGCFGVLGIAYLRFDFYKIK